MQKIKRKCLRAVAKFLKSGIGQRLSLIISLIAFTATEMLAASKGAAGFTKATTEVSSYQVPVSNLMKAIAAVIVLVGAFNVYFKMRAFV